MKHGVMPLDRHHTVLGGALPPLKELPLFLDKDPYWFRQQRVLGLVTDEESWSPESDGTHLLWQW